ncbi:MAG TPA: ABC transporter permease [Thermoanaerobaculia bacterium]
MRIYRALLRLYPSSFRGEYGEEMCAIFAERLRGKRGFFATIRLEIDALADILPTAFRSHMDLLRQDLRYTARTLTGAWGFTATAILVVALGIGATTAAFSITDHVLIRPLPFPRSQDLIALWENQPHRGISRMELSPGNFRDWKRLSTSFESMGACSTFSMNLVGTGSPERLDMAYVTWELFPTLGVAASVGRIFTAGDDSPGAAGTVVLSDRLWRSRFAADPNVLGHKVILNGDPYEVIGVMPGSFRYPERETQFWTPFRFAATAFTDRTDTYLSVVGRLQRGVSLASARAEMQVVAKEVERAHPKENARTGATVGRLHDELSRQSRLLLTVLFGASLGVLLISCTNLANLLLVRALGRRHEFAVRLALGAGRERVIRQLVTESLVIAVVGGALGVGLALAAGPLMVKLVPDALPIAQTPPVDLRLLGFAAFVTVATALAFGVLPAIRVCGEAASAGLQADARAGAGRRTEALRGALVIAEVAASVALLIGSGLLIRALWRLKDVDPGFRSDGVLALRTELPLPKYERTDLRVQFYDHVLSEVRGLPGVSGAGYVSALPMLWRGGIWPISLAGEPPDPADARMVSVRYVTPGYFMAMKIPLLAGRDVASTDTQKSPFVAVVSESFVRRWWPEENPIGRGFRVANDDRRVVGIAGEVRVRGLERESEPQVYLPAPQVADGDIIGYIPKDLVVRSSVAASTLLPSVRAIVGKADPQQPISDVRMVAEILEAETTPRSVQARILMGFAATALVLAGVGIHGLLAFGVSQRTREIGVRLALGAQSSEILSMVLRRGILLAAVGIAAGVTIAYGAGHAMKALLAGVSPADLATFAAAGAASLSMVILGCLFPALRAVRISPLTAIRSE